MMKQIDDRFAKIRRYLRLVIWMIVAIGAMWLIILVLNPSGG